MHISWQDLVREMKAMQEEAKTAALEAQRQAQEALKVSYIITSAVERMLILYFISSAGGTGTSQGGGRSGGSRA